MKKNSKIYVAGHRGMVGSALVRALQERGFNNILSRTHAELDLTDGRRVQKFFDKEKPDYVFLAAAKVGGIVANKTYPVEFLSENLLIQNNIIRNAHEYGVKKLIFLGSSCFYPREAPQPMKEEYMLAGKPEPTNEALAIAKIAGVSMCQSHNRQYGANFVSVVPTNLYGPNDNFDPVHSHVLAALIRKFHDAKKNGSSEVTLWGRGKSMREFLHVDDLARACLFIMDHYDDSEIINVGTGKDVTIKKLAEIIKATVGFTGRILWDATKPEGAPRKLLHIGKMKKLGW